MNSWPTEDEILEALKSGDRLVVGDVLVRTCCLEPRVVKRFREIERERLKVKG